MGKLCIKCISCASCLRPISINLIIIIAPFQQLLPKELGALCKCSLAAALGLGEEERSEAKRCHGQSRAGAAVGQGAVLGAWRKCCTKHNQAFPSLIPQLWRQGAPAVLHPPKGNGLDTILSYHLPGHRQKLEDQTKPFADRYGELERLRQSMRVTPTTPSPRGSLSTPSHFGSQAQTPIQGKTGVHLQGWGWDFVPGSLLTPMG